MSVDADIAKRERNERASLRIVGACFLALALYVACDAVLDLRRKTVPERSIPGIALAVVSLIVMPMLSRARKSVGGALRSAVMKADARQTDFCVYLSEILLVGLMLNATFGWWWADPVAALVMVPLIVKEGLEGIKARRCRYSGPTLLRRDRRLICSSFTPSETPHVRFLFAPLNCHTSILQMLVPFCTTETAGYANGSDEFA